MPDDLAVTAVQGNTLDRAEHWRFVASVEAFVRTICPEETRGRMDW